MGKSGSKWIQSIDEYLRALPHEVQCSFCLALATKLGSAATGNAGGWLAVTVYFCKACNKPTFTSVGVSE